MTQNKKQELDINEEEQVFNEKTTKFKTKKITPNEVQENYNNEDVVLETEQLMLDDDLLATDTKKTKPNKKEIKLSELLKTLDKSTRIYYYFLLIITFTLIRKMIISRIEDNTENVIKTSNEIPFNIAVLIHALGGKNNILDISATISSVKITLSNIEAVNKEEIKEVSQRGILISGDKITILFGNYSEKLKEILLEEISKK